LGEAKHLTSIRETTTSGWHTLTRSRLNMVNPLRLGVAKDSVFRNMADENGISRVGLGMTKYGTALVLRDENSEVIGAIP